MDEIEITHGYTRIYPTPTPGPNSTTTTNFTWGLIRRVIDPNDKTTLSLSVLGLIGNFKIECECGILTGRLIIRFGVLIIDRGFVFKIIIK